VVVGIVVVLLVNYKAFYYKKKEMITEEEDNLKPSSMEQFFRELCRQGSKWLQFAA